MCRGTDVRLIMQAYHDLFTIYNTVVRKELTISINLIDHVLKFSFSGVLTEGSHDCSQFLGGDGAITILVEEGESLLELSNLFLCQLISLKSNQYKLVFQRGFYLPQHIIYN